MRTSAAYLFRHRKVPIVLTVVATMLVATAVATAAPPTRLFQTPVSRTTGAGAGQLNEAEALAADPTTGDIFVADQDNNRVSEFGPFGQFIKAWGWGVATGAAELQTCGPGATPPTATCRRGISGSGAGQFANLKGGITVDSVGDVWVADLANHRVQKFDAAGKFLLMVGGGVNKGPNHPGNLCTATNISEGDTCGVGIQGSGPGEFETSSPGSKLAASAGGAVLVGDKGRIQELLGNGELGPQVSLEGQYAGKYVMAISRAASGTIDLLVGSTDFGTVDHEIVRLAPGGTVAETIPTPWEPTALAVDAEDHFYVALYHFEPPAHQRSEGYYREVLEFATDGSPILPFEEGLARIQAGRKEAHYYGLAANIVTAAGASDVYLTELQNATLESAEEDVVAAYGPGPDKWSPPAVPPEIDSQYASSVTSDSATVGAEINPHFWADTTYSVEFGTGRCIEGGCAQVLPASPAALGGGVGNEPVAAPGIEIAGLAPVTVYHFRFIAQSSGGGPVKGVGAGEAEGTFTTPLPFHADESCPNQALRVGGAAGLPDCRAYEMVSPVDKNGADIYPLINVNEIPIALDQSTEGGEKLAYSDYQSFGDGAGAPYMSQYIASRGPDGWTSQNVTAPQGISSLSPGHRLELGIWQFTPDLCASSVLQYTDPALAPGAVPGFRNAYLRKNCAGEGYEALSTVEPPSGTHPLYFLPAPQGMSADGRCAVVGTSGIGAAQAREIYESCEGHRTAISLLPNGAPASRARVGSSNGIDEPLLKPRIGNVAGAVSQDGERVYWSEGEGKIFVRVNASQEPSALSGSKCTEAEKACTEKVSQTASGAAAQFLAASADGGTAYFSIREASSPLDGNLYAFNLDAGSAQKIAGEFIGEVGASADGSRFAFASREVLTTQPNSAGRMAVAGEANLYYFNAEGSGEGRFLFVGTLSAQDALVENLVSSLSPIASEPFRDVSRMSGSGAQFAFMSTASLTGYDNTDLNSGEADAEVYLFDSTADGGAGRLTCVSCNPSGQRPAGRQLKVELKPGTWAASSLPPYQTEFYGARVLSSNGTRVYFNSYESLSGNDENGGVADVYEWETAGTGDCVVGGSGYSAANGGCINLISSGQSPVDSEFLEASADGRDVFFATNESLVPQDPGQYDIYDARELGGFPPVPTAPPACVGDRCQAEQSPPATSPAGTVGHGAGNPKDLKPSCAKGRRAVKKHGKWRCVKKAPKHKKAKGKKHSKGKGSHKGKKGNKKNHKSRGAKK